MLWVRKNPREISLKKMKKIHRQASAGEQGEYFAIFSEERKKHGDCADLKIVKGPCWAAHHMVKHTLGCGVLRQQTLAIAIASCEVWTRKLLFLQKLGAIHGVTNPVF